MNYYAARQREDDKKWDYTCKNDGRTWPIGYCGSFLEAKLITEGGYYHTQQSADRHNSFKKKYGPHNHETKEEAQACYKEYLLDNAVHFHPPLPKTDEKPMTRTEHRCQVDGCESYDTGIARVEQRDYFLCQQHMTREEISKLLQVGECWSSY
jgi:hypothetical protein